MQAKFEKLVQVGIIVNNLENAVQNYEKMGISGWKISAHRNDAPPMEDLKYDGEEFKEKGIIIKIAIATWAGVELELIEPVADSKFKTWLENHGPGIHHMAIKTDKTYQELLASYAEEEKREPWVHGQGIGGIMDFSYLDLRDELGIIFECYREDAD